MRNAMSLGGTKYAIRKLIATIMFTGVLIVAVANGTASAAPSPSVPSPPSGPAVVMTKTGPAGTYLADGSGKTLYLFANDTAGKSTCSGACAAGWPPYTTSGNPTAGPGVTASMLSTLKRDDGSTQVVYNGHPLYYFSGDKAAGDTAGQGFNAFGGLWWLVSPAGTPIQTKPSPSPSPGGRTGGSGGIGGAY